MTREHLYVILIFMSGMAIALAIVAYEYLKFKRSHSITLKVAQQSPKWKKLRQILENDFTYYKNLPAELKPDFVFRTYKFMKQCNWISSSQPIVKTYQKVLISASATQLTFGLKAFDFGRFKTILLHEDAYYNRQTRRYHRGEVNQAGLIVLSWKYFEEGYANEADKINLGLHEMAHAMDLALLLSHGRMYNIHRLMEKFRQSAFEQLVKIRRKGSDFFREYGTTNPREFFSVAVEHFFEAPKDFKEQLPELYLEMCQLLNQDPGNRVFRGFKSPNANRFSNAISVSSRYHNKPQIVLKPNFNLIIPLITFSVIYALFFPVINAIIAHWTNFLAAVLAITYGTGIYLIINSKANTLKLINKHIIITKPLARRPVFTAHINNIVNTNFTYMLTYYRVDIAYFEGEDILTSSHSLYFSPANIKKLERILLQQNVRIKHNNKWLKKEIT